MKILYLTGDTRVRASAFSLFLPLYRELESTGVVDIKEVNAFPLYGDGYKAEVFKGRDASFIKKQLDVSFVNNTYDIIVLENAFPFWNEDWNKIESKKVLVLGDLHRFSPKGKHPNFMQTVVDRIGINAVFSKYIETYNKDYKDINLPVYHWPHSIDPNTFNDYKLNKEYGVLSTGMLSKNIYPVRREIYSLFKDKSYFKRIDRPNNRMDRCPNPWPTGKDYSKEINKSLISVACTSIYNYTIAKIFEIPASKSVLLCDYTEEMKSLGFIPGENFIQYKGKNGFIEFIENIMKSNELSIISENGYKMVHEKHNVKKRVEEFINYCKEVV